jgi:hypothetical protein
MAARASDTGRVTESLCRYCGCTGPRVDCPCDLRVSDVPTDRFKSRACCLVGGTSMSEAYTPPSSVISFV